MLENAVLVAFATMLVVGCVLGMPLAAILAMGLALFVAHGLVRGFGIGELARAGARSARSVGNVLLLLTLIGALTASWRLAGTIPTIVAWSSGLLSPTFFSPATFVLCALVSVLTGSAFATAATMGAICMTIAHAGGSSELLAGAAVLAGSYVGDRCSPMSSSAALVCAVTGTDLHDNLVRMVRGGWPALLLSCGAFLAMGCLAHAPAISGAVGPAAAPAAATATGTVSSAQATDVATTFSAAFALVPAAVLPAVTVLALVAARVGVRTSMLASLACAVAVGVTVQGTPIADVPRALLLGYVCPDPAVGAMVDGGGVSSMANVLLIVGVSSCYAGIFELTGLLDSARGAMTRLAAATTPFASVLASATVTGMVACNQALTIMLTRDLCADAMPDRRELAIAIEDTCITVSPLVPWAISNAAVLQSSGAPASSTPLAVYLWMVPLVGLVRSVVAKKRSRREEPAAPRV